MAKRRRLPTGWRRFLVLNSVETEENINYELCFAKGKIPKGLKKVIGTFSVDKEEPHFVDGPWIEEDVQRLGLGTMMYERAMMDLGSISTKWQTTTEEGRGGWTSLMRRWPHKINIDDQEVTVFWQRRIPIF